MLITNNPDWLVAGVHGGPAGRVPVQVPSSDPHHHQGHRGHRHQRHQEREGVQADQGTGEGQKRSSLFVQLGFFKREDTFRINVSD